MVELNPVMYRVGDYPLINLAHVLYVKPWKGRRYFYYKKIETFKVVNYFRKLLGLKTIKPRRMNTWWKSACIILILSNKSTLELKFDSNKQMFEEFDKLEKYMERFEGK